MPEWTSGAGLEPVGWQSHAFVADVENVVARGGLAAEADGLAGAGCLEGVGQEFEEDHFERVVVEGGPAVGKLDTQVGGASGCLGALAAGGGEACGPICAGMAGGVLAEGGAGGEFGDEIEAAHLLGEAAPGGVNFFEALAQGFGGGLASGFQFGEEEG